MFGVHGPIIQVKYSSLMSIEKNHSRELLEF